MAERRRQRHHGLGMGPARLTTRRAGLLRRGWSFLRRMFTGNWRRIGCAGAGVAAVIAALERAHAASVFGLVMVLVYIPLLVAFGPMFSPIGRMDERAVQRRRDKRASARLDDQKQGRSTFFLYLRPFASTGGVQIVRSITLKPTRHRSMLVTRWNDIEALLARYLEPYGPLVGLGRPGEQIGAGRIPSDSEGWQELVTSLAATARLLFLLPAMDSGTRWEMDLVLARADLLSKTIFIVPGSGKIADYVAMTRPPGPLLDGTWSYRRDAKFESLVRSTSVKALEMGAKDNPRRSSEELRRGAIQCLGAIGAYKAARIAADSPNGMFLTLGSRLEVRAAHPFKGYIGGMFSRSFYRLDVNVFRWSLAGLVEEAQEP